MSGTGCPARGTVSSSRRIASSVVAFLVGLGSALDAENGLADTIARVSVAGDGSQAEGISTRTSISDDGRFVAFVSTASNLVPDDTNAEQDIFVHDRDADEDGIFDEPGEIRTVRVNLSSTGAEADNTSIIHPGGGSALSSDGRYVVFDSRARTLTANDINGQNDVFVRDRDADENGIFDEPGGVTTIRASVASDGTGGDRASNTSSISGDGRYVAFWSSATNLVPGVGNGIYLRDTQSGQTVLVSVSDAGVPANDATGEPAISPGGRYVAFHSFADNLVDDDTNGTWDVFVYDRDGVGLARTVRVSVASDGTQANGRSDKPSVSADGRYVAFLSDADNLVPDDDNHSTDVFVRDRDTDADGLFDEPDAVETRRASVASQGSEANGSSLWPAISADGRYVSFASAAENLVADDDNRETDVFVHDLQTGLTARVSLAFDGAQPDDDCTEPSISAQGTVVAFSCRATNMVPDDTNGWSDVFVPEPSGGLLGAAALLAVGVLARQRPGSTHQPAHFR